MTHIPVVTIDGPSGSGKGTISQLLARKLGWHYLDSGAIYRVLALAAMRNNIAVTDQHALMLLAVDLPLQFVPCQENYRIMLENKDVTDQVRTEECSRTASIISAWPKVRDALLGRQRAFQQSPGLVTDGRDMGTVIFPWADVKIFMEASAEERAERRFNQLRKLGIGANIQTILFELQQRDERDRTRSVAPLKPASDAVIIDTTYLTVEQSIAAVYALDFFRNGTHH
jgi:cytidylate kinase